MAKIVYRQMRAPWELSQQIPPPWAKARMQKPQGGGKFLVQIPGGARGMVWMKLIPELRWRWWTKEAWHLCSFSQDPLRL